MSTPVTYVGVQYNIPAYQDTGYAQGAGNLSSYLIALATGSLTLAGGTFTLTADVDFGATFGIQSTYFKSREATTSPSTVGILRLGASDMIGWRNNADSGNVSLSKDTADALYYLGGDFKLDAGKCVRLVSPDGTKSIRFGLDNDGNFGEM